MAKGPLKFGIGEYTEKGDYSKIHAAKRAAAEAAHAGDTGPLRTYVDGKLHTETIEGHDHKAYLSKLEKNPKKFSTDAAKHQESLKGTGSRRSDVGGPDVPYETEFVPYQGKSGQMSKPTSLVKKKK